MVNGASPERWVFGYGSLMWRPGFDYLEARPAVLHGWRRAFCVYSIVHRGTCKRPGLVLGLVPGGQVRGTAFRIAEHAWAETHAYLLDREHPSESYFPAEVEIALHHGRQLCALTFLSDTDHSQWAGELDLERQARLIAGARGLSGRNVDYLRSLVLHLIEQGAPDPAMEGLLARVEMLEADEPAAAAAA
jgi:cation transport protein ChaC